MCFLFDVIGGPAVLVVVGSVVLFSCFMLLKTNKQTQPNFTIVKTELVTTEEAEFALWQIND